MDLSTLPTEPTRALAQLIESGDADHLRAYLATLSPADTARATSRLQSGDQNGLLTLLGPEMAADLIEEVAPAQAVDLIEDLPHDQAAAILDQMHSDHQADLLGDLDEGDAQAILERMAPEEARDARELLAYPEDTAGGLMVTEYLAYPDRLVAADVLDDLRANRSRYTDYDVQYVYVTDDREGLVGVLRLRDLLLCPVETPLRQIMLHSLVSVRADTSLDDLQRFFDHHPFLGVPVVDGQNRLRGVVRRASARSAGAQSANRTFLKVSGIVGGEELRSMPLLDRCVGRLSWLSVNILLNVLAASVIALYQDTLAQAIILAVFLPIISDMSGCSGNQAVAVSIRELTLGVVRPREVLHVLAKESSLGLLNGISLGILLGVVALVWQGNPYLGLVVGGSLALNTLLSVCLGGTIPLLLKWSGKDPALASGPILTTVTDMCGFLLVLQLATLVLPHLI